MRHQDVILLFKLCILLTTTYFIKLYKSIYKFLIKEIVVLNRANIFVHKKWWERALPVELQDFPQINPLYVPFIILHKIRIDNFTSIIPINNIFIHIKFKIFLLCYFKYQYMLMVFGDLANGKSMKQLYIFDNTIIYVPLAKEFYL